MADVVLETGSQGHVALSALRSARKTKIKSRKIAANSHPKKYPNEYPKNTPTVRGL